MAIKRTALRWIAVVGALAACGARPRIAATAPTRGALTVIDEAGHPVAGADVEWGISVYWWCDPRQGAPVSYAAIHRAKTDRDGHIPGLEPARAELRAATGDHRVGFGRADDTYVMLRRTYPIDLEPTCDGHDCAGLVWTGEIKLGERSCGITGAAPKLSLTVPGGQLLLHAHVVGPTPADERAVTVQASVDSQLVIAPAMPTIAGTLTLRGAVTPRDARVDLVCGTGLHRSAVVDPRSGQFVATDLPTGDCVLTARAGAAYRELRVTTGGTIDVKL